MPGLIIHDHIDQHIARIKLALRFALLAVANLDDLFGGHQNLTEIILHPVAFDALYQSLSHLLFIVGVGMHDVV